MDYTQFHAAVIGKIDQFGDASKKQFDDLRDRIERIEALGDRPRGTGTDTLSVAAKSIFDDGQMKNFLSGRSEQAGFTVPLSAIMPERKDALITDVLGNTSFSPTVSGSSRVRPWISDYVAREQTTSSSVGYLREAASSSATAGVQGATASPQKMDGSAKDEADLVAEVKEAKVLTVAIYNKVSLQALSDVQGLREWMGTRLAYAVRSKLDSMIIGTGTGTFATFSGITGSGNYTAYSLTSPLSTSLDNIRLAIADCEGMAMAPDLVVMSPDDLATIDTSKASSAGVYLSGSPRQAMPRTLWGVPVIAHPDMGAGKFVVGNFAMGATLWTREEITIRFGLDGSDFTRNLVTCLVEMRAAFGTHGARHFVAAL